MLFITAHFRVSHSEAHFCLFLACSFAPTIIHARGARPYVHYTPSQGSANRSASEGVLGAMARPAPVSPLFIAVLPPPLNSPTHTHRNIENHGNSAKFNFTPCLISKSGEVVHIALYFMKPAKGG